MTEKTTGLLARYRLLPTLVPLPQLALALIARAPYAMLPLGTMTAMTASSGSVAVGGVAAGLVAIAGSAAAPLIGRWSDAAGQRRVLSILTPINAVALIGMLCAALLSWNGPALWAVCLAVGLTGVPVGSFTRSRWVGLSRSPRDLDTAFSYESTADEMVFVLGPAIVGLAASLASSWAPLALAATLVLLAGIPFALSSPTIPEHPCSPTGSFSVPSRGPGIGTVLLRVLPALVVMWCIGSLFGSVQAGTTERAAELGSPGVGGLIYAAMGLGSATTALLVVLVPEQIIASLRVGIGGIGMATLLMLTILQSTVGATTVTLLLTGLFIGPTMVTAFSMAERRAPAGGTGVAMTSMQSAVTVGVATGSAAGGALAAAHGSPGAYGLAVGVSALAAALGITRWAHSSRRRKSSA